MIDALFGDSDLQPPIVKITRDGLHESLNELKESAALQPAGQPSLLLVSLAAATPLFLLALLLVGAPLGVLLALALALPLASLLLYVPSGSAARSGVRSGARSGVRSAARSAEEARGGERGGEGTGEGWMEMLGGRTLGDLHRSVMEAVRRGRAGTLVTGI